MSLAVAPGHMALTITTLMVNEGSSARPRLRYESAPARPNIAIRNSIRAGWATAQAERLKRRIATSCKFTCLACSERQRGDHPDLLARIELLHASHDDVGALLDAALDQDVVALVGLHGDALARERTRLDVRDIERRSVALVEQRRERQPRDGRARGIGQRQRRGHAELHVVIRVGDRKLR